MPKRRHWSKYSKPQTTAPHSLESSGLQSTLHHEEPRTRNVNDLLASLRRASLSPGASGAANGGSSSTSGGPSLALSASHVVVTPTVPPEIAQILLPDVPVGPPAMPAGGAMAVHAQGGVLVGAAAAAGPGGPGGPGGRRRAPAGPAPPPSWLSQSRHAPRQPSLRAQADKPDVQTGRIGKGTEMPGMATPEHGSLVDVVLRQMTCEWDVQRHYNQYYLPYLQGPLKAALVSRLSARAAAGHGGVTVADLRALLLPPAEEEEEEEEEEVDDAPVHPSALNDDFYYLDLALSIGQSIQFRELSDLLFPSRARSRAASAQALALQESWDADAAGQPSLPRPLLPNLTHLSLARRPGSATPISWRQLLAFAGHLPTLTHLSLAYWPEPTLTPNAKFATVVSPVGGRRVQYGGTGPYSHSLDNDWAEAILVVRKLSKALYGLEYLDLTGCTAWLPALTSRAERDAIDWVGDWGKISMLVLRYGEAPAWGAAATTSATAPSPEPQPGEVARQVNAASEVQMVERHIQRQRAGRGRFITVVGDRPADMRPPRGEGRRDDIT